MSPTDDDRGELHHRFVPAPGEGYAIELKGGDAGTADGPGEPGYVRITAPATDAGRVDFREMLSETWQPPARDRLNAVIGRPYLATQLVEALPADLVMRLTDRLEGLIHEAVQRELDKLHDELDQVTAATLARLAAQADTKLEELKRERFSSHPSTRWGG